MTVSGDSMTPVISPGDVVRVRAGGSPRMGDIVVVQAGRGLIVHRFIGRSGDGFLHRGDNSPRPDPVVQPDDVLGRVTAVELPLGLARRLDTPTARGVGMATALCSRALAALGHGPRPKHVPAVASALARILATPTAHEDELVLLVARRRGSAEADERARALIQAGQSWDRVIDRARLGQLGPLLHVGFRRLGVDAGVPPEVSDRMRALYAANHARSRAMRAILVRVLDSLAAADILPIAHKGAALSVAVFDDPALNISGDLDLSVPDDVHRLAENAASEVRSALSSEWPDRRDMDSFHVELDREAHHDVDPSIYGGGRWRASSLDWAAIRARASLVAVDGRAMLVPAPADLLLTLTANAVRRGFSTVRLVSNIAETIAHFGGALEWGLYSAEVRRSRLDRRSWIALGLAADWFGAEVPAHLLEPPADLRTAFYERWLIERKRRQPFTRLPTRVLWAGSARRAIALAAGLAWSRL